MGDTLDRILNPRSVALIGVSRNPTSFSYTYLSIMRKYGFKGRIYPVNPKADSLLELKCYPRISDVPDEIDVAVVLTARDIALTSIEEATEKGVRGIVMIGGGFAEVDDEGRRLQEQAVEKAKVRGIRIIGPNCMGYYSAPVRFDGLLSGFIRPGDVALIAQSGNVTRSLAFPGIKRGLGFSYIIDLGNRADVEFHELIRYFRTNEQTKVIGLYIEGLREGRNFIEEVRETTKTKPVIVLKSGQTDIASRVISSHTATLAGRDEVYDAAFAQCGAIRVENVTQLGSMLLAVSRGKLPRGNRVGLMSEGGGDCAITADACIRRNLAVPEFSAAKQDALRQIVSHIGQVTNPVDLAGWQKQPEVTEVMLEGDEIDGMIITGGFAGWDFLNPNVAPEVEVSAHKMVDLVSRTRKPILIYTYYAYQDSKSLDILRQNNIPLFMNHHDAVDTMAGMVQYQELKSKMEGRRFLGELPAAGGLGELRKALGEEKIVPENRANQLLRKYGLTVPPHKVAGNPEEAVQYAAELGSPVVLKIVSPDILHKSDAGCVRLNLRGNEQVRRAFDEVVANAEKFKPGARVTGVLVSRMDAEDGVEVIIGAVNDRIFGPTVMFGLGGIFVELFRDLSFRVCPIDKVDAEQMIQAIKGYPLLAGARGRKAVDVESVQQALLGVSSMIVENPEVSQLDLNPIKVHRSGYFVLDARMILV